mmetsp:Transcript_6130/g.15058  ORF Transcript_6130/g.15058 Transcript_6130/m.15058 type:complete len:227 (+) Transcript_6130:2835-3515(+)
MPGGSGMSSTYTALPATCFPALRWTTGSPTGARLSGPSPWAAGSTSGSRGALEPLASPFVNPPPPSVYFCSPRVAGLGAVTKFCDAEASAGTSSGGGGSADASAVGRAASVAVRAWDVATLNLKRKLIGSARRYSHCPPGTSGGSGMSADSPANAPVSHCESPASPPHVAPVRFAMAVRAVIVVGPMPPKAMSAASTFHMSSTGAKSTRMPPVTIEISSSRRLACL